MTHLGSHISSLVDGQLSPAATERALAHVAACPQCAAELRAARAARAALAGADDHPRPDADLTARLLSIAPRPLAVRPVADPFAPPSGPVLAGRPVRALRGDLGGGRHLSSRLLAGSLAGVGVVAAALFVLGARPAVVPSDQPAQTLTMLGQASVRSVDATAADGSSRALAEVAAAGWPVPDLPIGWAVTAVRLDESGAVLELHGPTGTAVVVEQAGHLVDRALTGVPTLALGGRDVYVLSAEPAHIAWQCDAAVVEVVAGTTVDGLDALVAAFPAAAYDDGVPARIGRGWATVAHVLEAS